MPQFKFELDSSYKREFIKEPVGWDTRKPTLTRNETYSGLFRAFTVDLEFVGNGYEHVKYLRNTQGILAFCRIYIYEYNNKSHTFELQDEGVLDFTTYEVSDKSGKGATISVSDTSFTEKIKSREDVLINYNNAIDLDGEDMTAPKYIDTEILGMDVLSISNIKLTDEGQQFYPLDKNFYIPNIEADGQIKLIKNVIGQFVSGLDIDNREDVSFFKAVAPGTNTIKGTIYFDCYVANNGPNFELVFSLVQYRTGTGTVDLVVYETPNQNNTLYKGLVFDIDHVFTIEEGDLFYFIVKNGQGQQTGQSGWIDIKESNLDMTNLDKALPTVSKGARLFDVFNRMIESITSKKNVLISPVLDEDGKYYDYTLQNGLLIRNYTEEEAQMSFKFKDLFQSCERIFNIGLSIDGNKVTIDDKRNFFRDGVVHTIEAKDIEVDSFVKSIDTDYYYSDVEVGYAKSAYEEISGLEEYNNKSAYNTIISNLNNKIDAISKLRGDGYGIEFARRLQKFADETSDSKYDKDNFILNIIFDGIKYVQRTTEGFDSVTGIDFNSTPANLEITPARNLRRWGWMLTAGLQKYTDKLIRFNSSDVRSDLSTTLGGETVTESTDITYQELDNPLFTGDKIQFSAPLSLEDYKKIKASPYQIIKVWNPVDEVYNFGWIKEVGMESVDKSTNWELIEAIDAVEILNYWLWNSGFKMLWNNGGGILLNNQT